MTKREIKLWHEMAAMTLAKCRESCHDFRSCCSPEYCEMASEIALKHGVKLEPASEGKLPFLGPEGCVAPPQFRQLCSLHQCKIAGLGFDPKDLKWTRRYFALRDKLSMIGFKEGGK